ncbi:MAG: hypothetical protein RL217_502 [Pseudomonadota bacterium]|jgi:hypothetical protein
MYDDNLVDFAKASEKLRLQKQEEEKDAKAAELRARFAQVVPEKKKPVKEYFNKKKNKKR